MIFLNLNVADERAIPAPPPTDSQRELVKLVIRDIKITVMPLSVPPSHFTAITIIVSH